MSGDRPPTTSGAGDRAAGRSADVRTLRRRLATAAPPFLDGALDNPALGEAELRLLLRNRLARSETLAAVAEDPRWSRHHTIRALVVRHPAAPLALARRLVAHLFWRELSETAADLRVHPLVRRQAETTLRLRLEGLARGERIALARRATRGVISALVHSDDGRLLLALLENPRLTEADLVTIAAGSRAPGSVLARLGGREHWNGRPAIRHALLRNPRTPVATALRLVARCNPRELRALIRDAKVPTIVRMGAERRSSEGGATRFGGGVRRGDSGLRG